MTEQSLTWRPYVYVCVLLIGLTMATIGLSFLPLDGKWHLGLGLSIATVKASLVVLVFMHLCFSKPLTWVVASVTVFWLLLLVVLTLTDYMSRGLVPHAPGH